MVRPSEEKFEDHFCKKLEDHNYRKRHNKNIDLEFNIDDEILTEFLEKTQKEELKEIKIIFGDDWLKKIKEEVQMQLENKKLFEVLKNGVKIESNILKLIYFKPETSYNQEQWQKYNSNIFSYVRQFHFKESQESIDIVLFLNGFALVTTELKNPFNGQVVDDAVVQYIADRDKSLPIFKTPILHIASDTKQVKITTEFLRNTMEDFVWFNKELENPIVPDDFQVEYLYNEILTPDSMIEIIEHYLFCFDFKMPNGDTVRTFFFPRYHQRRTVINITKDIIKKYKKNKKLDIKYLIQHSAGSGKSYTIAVVQKFLRYLHINNQPLLDSIIILTDRINLDSQLKGTVLDSETQKDIISHVETTDELAEALNKNVKVIISTIQKFSVKKLDEILEDQKGKRICFIIDEAHRSQSGKLQRHLLGHFEEDDESTEEDKAYFNSFFKRRFPNFIFIALTSTPSPKTITMFGLPFDIYGMDQAEQEGYILNVSENIVTYDTLFQLSEKLESDNEYHPLLIAKKLKAKAYEDTKVIIDKVNIILKIFDSYTRYAIKDNFAKAMVVTSSRKSAVKFKIIMDKIMEERKLNYKTLVAFTASVSLNKNELEELEIKDKDVFTEVNMNKISEEIEDEFKKPEYRFLIVANKYQYGFNEPLLHTMFLDKSVSDINAVQTISRLDRIYPNKNDTLTVDFTNSYKKIIMAFRKFKKEVNDYSEINIKELPELYNELLNKNVFTRKDINNFKNAYIEGKDVIKLDNIASLVERNLNSKYSIEERRVFRSSLSRFNNIFNYLNNLFRITDEELKDFALFSHYLYNYLNPEGKNRKLDEDLKKVYLKTHRIKLESKEPIIKETTKRHGAKREIEYVTVKEVVEAINTRFKMMTTDNENVIIEDYINNIIKDQEIISDLEGNKEKDLDKVYEAMISKKLSQRFIDYFIEHNPEKLSEYIRTGISKFINLEAFRLLVSSHSL